LQSESEKKRMEPKKNLVVHLLAIATSCIWGTTFASTKVLIEHGLSPAEIMCTRFLMAYIGIWIIAPRQLFSRSLRDEMLLVAAGLTGGSLYFLAENTALQYTYSANVGILVATIPLAMALVSHLFIKGERFHRELLYGGVVALIGISLVVLNGQFILKINPLGDMLTMVAVFMWVIYGLLLKKLEGYSTVFITRKVFFYGIITILPVFLTEPTHFQMNILSQTIVWGNLIYLGIIASLGCYLTWNYVVKKLGVVSCTNYLYLNPIAALLTSICVIGERVTWVALLGSILILTGVFVSEKKKKKKKQIHK